MKPTIDLIADLIQRSAESAVVASQVPDLVQRLRRNTRSSRPRIRRCIRGAARGSSRPAAPTGRVLPAAHVGHGRQRCRRRAPADRNAAVVHHDVAERAGLVVEEEAEAGATPVVPLDAVEAYIVSAFIGLLRWWMEQPNRSSAEEVDRQFRALSLPALTAALGAGPR